MKQLQRYREDITRFGVILVGVVSALILFIQSSTKWTLALSFLAFAVLVIVLFKFI